jgi:Leucine-rich repeat (LRR) protein
VSGDKSIPESFGYVSKKMKTFNMSGNRLEALPESFSHLKTLEKLDLGSARFEPERSRLLRYGNNIYHLPKEFGLHFESLVELRLDECGINELPEGFGRSMTQVKLIDLHCNSLSRLPNSFCAMKNLETLTISLNYLTILPSDFGNLTSLQECFLSSNLVSNVSCSVNTRF